MKSIAVQTRSNEEFIDITDLVKEAVIKSRIVNGICLIYVPHTTAGVTVNENADPSVKTDILMALRNAVPESLSYGHGEGNSPAHVKATLVGPSLCLAVENSAPVLGTWQGVFFCEFDGPRTRKLLIQTIPGGDSAPENP